MVSCNKQGVQFFRTVNLFGFITPRIRCQEVRRKVSTNMHSWRDSKRRNKREFTFKTFCIIIKYSTVDHEEVEAYRKKLNTHGLNSSEIGRFWLSPKSNKLRIRYRFIETCSSNWCHPRGGCLQSYIIGVRYWWCVGACTRTQYSWSVDSYL